MIPAEGSRKSEKKNTVFLLRSYQAKTVERRRRSGARYLHMIFVLPGLFFPRDPLVPIKAFHLSLSLSLRRQRRHDISFNFSFPLKNRRRKGEADSPWSP
jgi:hypothetical protein